MLLLISGLACRGSLDIDADAQGDCVLELSQESLDFGEWSWGESPPEEQPLRLSNAGDGACTLLALETTGEDFEVGPISAPVIEPLTTRTLSIRHDPALPGPSEDTLALTTEAGTLQVTLTGTATAPELSVEPESLELSAPLGCTLTESLILRNTGLEDLLITDVQLDGPPLDTDAALLPWLLEPGEQRELVVEYAPLAEVPVETWLSVDSNDPLRPNVLVPIQAQAEATGWVEERFEVPSPPAVDFLITVDTSSSMIALAPDWESLIAPFFSAMDADGVDYQVAGVVADDGCVLTDPLFSDPSMSVADKAALFADMVCSERVDACNQHFYNGERPFTVMEAALDSDNLRSGGCNEGLVREAAALALVAIGDEPEQSVNPYTYYVSLFQSLKADPDQVTVNAVSGDYPSGCKMASGSSVRPMVGAYEATVATGGVYLSICDSAWPTQLAAAAPGSAGEKASFELGSIPVPETLEVHVDGVPMPSGWTWVASTNTVDMDSPPAAGSTVAVTYAEAGGCP